MVWKTEDCSHPHRGEIALCCRSVWDVNSMVQIIKIANWKGGGKEPIALQFSSSSGTLQVRKWPPQCRGCYSSRQFLVSSTFSCRECWLFHKQHEMSKCRLLHCLCSKPCSPKRWGFRFSRILCFSFVTNAAEQQHITLGGSMTHVSVAVED